MISFALIFCTFLAYSHSIRSVCYFDDTAQYRSGIGTYKPENIDPMLCTHIVYSYAWINSLQLGQTEWNDQTSQGNGMYFDVLKLRNVNTNLKVLLAAGRLTETADQFFPAVATNISRATFASNLIKYARDRTFDGVILEWASLAANSNTQYDKAKFLLLLKAIREAFDADSQATGKARLILAVNVPAKKREIDTGYLIPEIVQQSDFISVRAFDMRTANDKVVGLSSPFLSAPNATGDDKYMNVKWVANYYKSMGIPKDKVNIGISTYGRTFKLKDEKNNSIGDEAVADGDMGQWSLSSGVIGHYEICQLIWDGGEVFNVPEQGGRFYVDGDNWISYEDTLSIVQKACFIKTEGFGGITFWTLDLDDFSGQGCREGKYPIITTALSVMSSPDMSPCSLLNSTNYVEALYANTTEPTNPPAPIASADTMRVVCYYQRLAYYRQEESQFVPEDINPDICTHIVYAHAILNRKTILQNNSMETSEPWREGLFGRFANARKRNPALKVLLGVITGVESKYYYWPFRNIRPSTSRLRWVAKHALEFIKKHGFQGLEITWIPHENEPKLFFPSLFQAFRWVIDDDARIYGGSPLILSIVMPADKARIDYYGAADISTFEGAADFLSIRTYDFHGSWEVHTGFNAPVFGAPYESGDNIYLNWDTVARYYVSLGVPKHKINLIIPTFARTYTLQDEQYNGPYAAVTGAGTAGDYTREPGLLAFYEVCDFIDAGAKVVRVSEQKVPYAYLGNQWVSYEDAESVGEKACYARKLGIGGVGVWTMDMDDFLGMSCGKGKYPLLSEIYRVTQNMASSYCSNLVAQRSTSGTDGNLQRLDVMVVYLLLLLVLAFYTT